MDRVSHSDELVDNFLKLQVKDALDYETQHKNLSDDWYSLWRTYLKQKVAKSSIWRTFWTKLDKTLGDTEPTDYKEICMIIDHKAKELDKNWRQGNFKLSKIRQKGVSSIISMDDDYILDVPEVDDLDYNFHVLDRHNLREKWRGRLLAENDQNWNIFHALIYKNILIFCGHGMMRIIDGTTQEEVNQVKEPSDWPIDHACVGSNGYLAAASGETESKNLRRLTVWRMKSPSDVTYVQHWTFESDILGLHMDDRFIAVLLFPKSTRSKLKGVELQLISLETQRIERSLCLPSKDSADVAYGDGLLLFVELKGSIRILDLSSGTFSRTVKCKKWKEISDIKINSKFIIIIESFVDGSNAEFRIYDRCAAEHPSASLDQVLLTSFQVPNLKVDNVWVSETRLICYGNKQKRLPEVDDSASIIQLDFAADLLNFSHKILSTVVKTFLKFKRTVIVRRKEFPLNYTQ